jgi:diaminopimelate epimerase
MKIIFHKYQGTGNDFVIIDSRGRKLDQHLTAQQIARLCDRRFGVGADGLILLSHPRASDFRMIYYNADGRESTMCGNGGRCLVSFAQYLGLFSGGDCSFEAIDGVHQAHLLDDGQVELEMTRPQGFRQFNQHDFWIDTGSPHYVRFTSEALEGIDVVKLGRELRYQQDFASQGGTNVNFARELEPGKLEVRTYERGVEDETLSCGTGVTACAYLYLRSQTAPESAPPFDRIQVITPGGELSVHVHDLMGQKERVMLCGPAMRVFGGEIQL